MPVGDSLARWEGLEEAVVVADAGSFVGGARILHVSTSHISRAVAALEERVGAQIFNRTTRRVTLTATGHVLIQQARQIIEARENLLTSLRGAGEVIGELRITCSTALGERFVAPEARGFALDHPGLTVTLELNNRLIDIIAEGYDLAIRTGHVSDPRLVGKQLALRPYETCASPAYLAQHGTPAAPGDLDRHECLVGTASTWHFLVEHTPRPVSPKGRWHCNSGAAVVDAAIAGIGICQLPRYYVRDHILAGRLVPILTAFRRQPEPVLAVYPQRGHLAPKVRQFVARLAESAVWADLAG